MNGVEQSSEREDTKTEHREEKKKKTMKEVQSYLFYVDANVMWLVWCEWKNIYIICVIGARRVRTKQKFSQHSEIVPQQTQTIDFFFSSFFLLFFFNKIRSLEVNSKDDDAIEFVFFIINDQLIRAKGTKRKKSYGNRHKIKSRNRMNNGDSTSYKYCSPDRLYPHEILIRSDGKVFPIHWTFTFRVLV